MYDPADWSISTGTESKILFQIDFPSIHFRILLWMVMTAHVSCWCSWIPLKCVAASILSELSFSQLSFRESFWSMELVICLREIFLVFYESFLLPPHFFSFIKFLLWLRPQSTDISASYWVLLSPLGELDRALLTFLLTSWSQILLLSPTESYWVP